MWKAIRSVSLLALSLQVPGRSQSESLLRVGISEAKESIESSLETLRKREDIQLRMVWSRPKGGSTKFEAKVESATKDFELDGVATRLGESGMFAQVVKRAKSGERSVIVFGLGDDPASARSAGEELIGRVGRLPITGVIQSAVPAAADPIVRAEARLRGVLPADYDRLSVRLEGSLRLIRARASAARGEEFAAVPVLGESDEDGVELVTLLFGAGLGVGEVGHTRSRLLPREEESVASLQARVESALRSWDWDQQMTGEGLTGFEAPHVQRQPDQELEWLSNEFRWLKGGRGAYTSFEHYCAVRIFIVRDFAGALHVHILGHHFRIGMSDNRIEVLSLDSVPGLASLLKQIAEKR